MTGPGYEEMENVLEMVKDTRVDTRVELAKELTNIKVEGVVMEIMMKYLKHGRLSRLRELL